MPHETYIDPESADPEPERQSAAPDPLIGELLFDTYKVERLMGEAPASAPPNREREAAINHYRKILYLDPHDEGARGPLHPLSIRGYA